MQSSPLSDAPAHGLLDLVARRGDFEKRLLLTGEVDVLSATELKAPRLHTQRSPIRWLIEGESVEVKKGQKIAEIDNTTLSTQLRDKTLAVAQAQVEIERQKWQDALVETDRQVDADRKRALWKRAQLDADVPPNILPKRDFLEKQLALKRAQAELDRAEEAVKEQQRTAQMDLELRQLNREKVEREVRWTEEAISALTIRAPADGLVIVGDHPEGRKFQVGDDIMMGVTIARMPTRSRMRVRAGLSDVDDGRVEVGMAAFVTLDARPDRRFAGTIAEVSPVAFEISDKSPRRVFRVAVDLTDEDASVLRPGLSARVEVVAARMVGKILVPRAALDFSALPYRVQLADGSSVEVTLGGCNPIVCVAESGVDEGTPLRQVAR